MIGLGLGITQLSCRGFTAAQRVVNDALRVFRTFGSDSHIWLPGVGQVNGLTAGNWIDSAGTVPAVIDNPVGKVTDSLGGIHATQSTTGSKPILRRGILNILLQSATPALQSVTLTAAPYTLAMYGTGSVVVAGGYVGTLNGTGASNLVVLNFTSLALITSFTPVGSVTSFGLFAGTLTAQQIQAAGGIPITTTAPASSSQGLSYWQFDGNDSLALSGPVFQMADDHCVIAAASVGAAAGMNNNVIICPSGDSVVASVKRLGQISYDAVAGLISASWFDGVNYDNLVYSYPRDTKFIATARKTGSTLELWVNGVFRATKQATASFTANTGSIGAYPTSLALGNFTGAIYYANAVKATVSDVDRVIGEKYAALAAGVTL